MAAGCLLLGATPRYTCLALLLCSHRFDGGKKSSSCVCVSLYACMYVPCLISYKHENVPVCFRVCVYCHECRRVYVCKPLFVSIKLWQKPDYSIIHTQTYTPYFPRRRSWARQSNGRDRWRGTERARARAHFCSAQSRALFFVEGRSRRTWKQVDTSWWQR
jgi:hypothetical protein